MVGDEYHGSLTFGKVNETVEILGNDKHVDGNKNEGRDELFSSDSDDGYDWKEKKKEWVKI